MQPESTDEAERRERLTLAALCASDPELVARVDSALRTRADHDRGPWLAVMPEVVAHLRALDDAVFARHAEAALLPLDASVSGSVFYLAIEPRIWARLHAGDPTVVPLAERCAGDMRASEIGRRGRRVQARDLVWQQCERLDAHGLTRLHRWLSASWYPGGDVDEWDPAADDVDAIVREAQRIRENLPDPQPADAVRAACERLADDVLGFLTAMRERSFAERARRARLPPMQPTQTGDPCKDIAAVFANFSMWICEQSGARDRALNERLEHLLCRHATCCHVVRDEVDRLRDWLA